MLPDLREARPEVPRDAVIGVRDRIPATENQRDDDLVWETRAFLPELPAALEDAIERLEKVEDRYQGPAHP